MESLSRLLFIVLLVFMPAVGVAQYSFTPTIHGAGLSECSQAAAEANRMLQGFRISGIPTKSECEKIRAQILAIKVSAYRCNIYYTCTPCTGTDMRVNSGQNAMTSGQPELNLGVAVRNGIDDYNYRREVQRMQSSFDLIVSKGNVDYSQTLDSIVRRNMDEQRRSGVPLPLKKMIHNVENAIQSTARNLMDRFEAGYGSDSELAASLKEAFASLTNVNVADYINKPNLTYQEQETINRYHEFCDEVLARMQHEYATGSEYQYAPYEMATYALHVYDDDPARGFDESCVPLTDVNKIVNVEERESVQKILDFLGENNNKADFQADLYYDKDRDKYILAFRGTETKLKDWIVDGTYLRTGQSPQHDIAAALGELILESGIPVDKLTITGHSLGGGLALLAGAVTGAETYAYDPLHLTTETVRHYNLDLSDQGNFHCYQEKYELLVRSGEVVFFEKNVKEKLKTPLSAVDRLLWGGINIWGGINTDNKDVVNIPIPIGVGTTTVVEIPDKGIIGTDSFSSALNHSQKDMLKGLLAADGIRASNFLHGSNMRGAIARMRAEKPYRQATSAILIDAGGLQFQRIERGK